MVLTILIFSDDRWCDGTALMPIVSETTASHDKSGQALKSQENFFIIEIAQRDSV